MPQNLVWISRAFLVGMAVFGIFYTYTYLTRTWTFAFSGSENWQNLWFIDDEAVIPFAHRFGWFLLWKPAFIATLVMIFSSLRLVILLLRGTYFEPPVVRGLQWVGGSAAVAGFCGLAGSVFEPRILTTYGAEKVAPLRIVPDSGESGILLTGLGLFLLARVLHVTVIMNRESKEIV